MLQYGQKLGYVFFFQTVIYFPLLFFNRHKPTGEQGIHVMGGGGGRQSEGLRQFQIIHTGIFQNTQDIQLTLIA